MKVLVCGSRYFENKELMADVLKQWNITEIIEGEARGADRLSRDWAVENNVPTKRFPANWELYGKRAGPIRNAEMLKQGNPDLVVAFRGPNSRGTQNMIDQATKAGVPVEIIDVGV